MANLVAFFCVLAFVLLASAKSNHKFRIIGGNPVKPGQYPFLVSIQYFGQHFCGGTIISEDVILTTAHCLKGKSARYISIVAGTHNLFRGGVEVPASGSTHHLGFVEKTDKDEKSDNDVGLVFLSSPLTYSNFIQPAELPSASEDFHDSDDYVVVAGWGTVSKDSGTTNVARYVSIPLWTRKLCLRYLPFLAKNMICAGSFDGQKNSCPGDSGGPLIKGKKVIGTVSYGYGCGTRNTPAVYASISNLRSWISLNAQV